MKIHIITAALPPLLDGIGDYTANLAAELARSANVTVLTGTPTPDPIPGVRVEIAFAADDPRSVLNLAACVTADQPDWVLLQYNPFSYGRWGLNLHLPHVIRRIKREMPRTRFALMVHEPFVPVISPQFAVMTTWQRWQLWRLGQAADVVFFSIEAWAQRFQKWFLGRPVVHLPVGSNIPLVPIGREEARARLGISPETVVLGLFSMASSGRLMNHVRGAVSALRQSHIPTQVLYIGPYKQQICAAFGTEDVIADGPFPAEEVSLRLAAMDIYMVAYIDGVSTRRGTLMVALQHGIATVGTKGELTDHLLAARDGCAFLLAEVGAPLLFAEHVLRLASNENLRLELGQQAKRFYHDEFSWENIAWKLQRHLSTIEMKGTH